MSKSLPAGTSVKVGDQVSLKRPDGSELETVVRGIEMGSRLVPIGTELWAK